MMKTELILALDMDNADRARQFVGTLRGLVKWIKIGSQLFVSQGPSIIESIKSDGYKIFLDLKLHDIPNTVARTVARMRTFGVDMLTVHTSGGKEMLQVAKKEGGADIKIVGVTVLTSLSEDDLRMLGVNRKLNEHVLTLAQLARESGIDGIVCSPMEAKSVRNAIGNDFIIVTPGIRLEQDEKDDQKRSLSPTEIKNLGINYIVVGRPILNADDPGQVVRKILNSLE
jgi:orotidine-5'-phosphate decarboxylase